MDDHVKVFFHIHRILDAFETMVLVVIPEYLPELSEFYKYKIKFYRAKFEKNKMEKILVERTLTVDITKIALWMAMALDEIHKVVLDLCRRREIIEFHKVLHSLVDRYGLGHFPEITDSSDESSSEAEDEEPTIESQITKIKTFLN